MCSLICPSIYTLLHPLFCRVLGKPQWERCQFVLQFQGLLSWTSTLEEQPTFAWGLRRPVPWSWLCWWHMIHKSEPSLGFSVPFCEMGGLCFLFAAMCSWQVWPISSDDQSWDMGWFLQQGNDHRPQLHLPKGDQNQSCFWRTPAWLVDMGLIFTCPAQTYGHTCPAQTHSALSGIRTPHLISITTMSPQAPTPQSSWNPLTEPSWAHTVISFPDKRLISGSHCLVLVSWLSVCSFSFYSFYSSTPNNHHVMSFPSCYVLILFGELNWSFVCMLGISVGFVFFKY